MRPDERLPDLLARLERERQEQDQLYNDALTALDQLALALPALPEPPAAYDDSKLTAVNTSWNILPSGAPVVDGSWRGRLRGFVWRLVGPALEQQKGFNAALVDHLNRNVAAHRESQAALVASLEALRPHLDSLAAFRARLLLYLQTITGYVDTKDRSVGGGHQILNGAISGLADDWLKRWEALAAREQRFNARVAAVDDIRATSQLAQQTALTLKREVERLTSGHRASGSSGNAPSETTVDAAIDLDAFKYLGFEDAFRGSPEAIRAQLASHVDRFIGASDVLDIGCGRGEFLDLLRERGIRARGIDLNHEMVEHARARGLDVQETDALSYLSSLPEASLGGIFSSQVVEHLEPAYLMKMLDAAFRVLRPGAFIVLETINAACWVAFFESYLRDLTHVRALHPDTLQYLLRASGFHDVTMEPRAPIDPSARLQPLAPAAAGVAPALADLVDTFNENVDKLNARMFTYQDYAAIGRR